MIDVKLATVYSLDLPDTDDLHVGRKRRYLSKYHAVRAYCAHKVLVKIANREDWGLIEWEQGREALHGVIVYSHSWRHYERYRKLYHRYYRSVLRAMRGVVGPMVSIIEWWDPNQELPPDLLYPCLVTEDGLVYPAVWIPAKGWFVNTVGCPIQIEEIDLWAFMPKPARQVDAGRRPGQMRAVCLEAREWLQHHGGDPDTDEGLHSLLARLDQALE